MKKKIKEHVQHEIRKGHGRTDGLVDQNWKKSIAELEISTLICRCLTTDSLPRGSPGQYVQASPYAELDGERKRQSIYPGSDPRP